MLISYVCSVNRHAKTNESTFTTLFKNTEEAPIYVKACSYKAMLVHARKRAPKVIFLLDISKWEKVNGGVMVEWEQGKYILGRWMDRRNNVGRVEKRNTEQEESNEKKCILTYHFPSSFFFPFCFFFIFSSFFPFSDLPVFKTLKQNNQFNSPFFEKVESPIFDWRTRQVTVHDVSHLIRSIKNFVPACTKIFVACSESCPKQTKYSKCTFKGYT